MGDRSPKDKMKKQKQVQNEHSKHQQQKQENMLKNRKDQGVPVAQDDQMKKAG
jgi:hypothetical protein